MSLSRFENEMRTYQEYKHQFLQRGFTENICKQVVSISSLGCFPLFYLFCSAQNIPDNGTYLEIGSAYGGSLLCVFSASEITKKSFTLIGIDPAPQQDFNGNVAWISNLKFFEEISDKAKDKIANNYVDLLLIDGDHSYEQVKRDIQNYLPKVKKGGKIIGDDYNLEGVKNASDEIFGDKLEFPDRTNFWVVEKCNL